MKVRTRRVVAVVTAFRPTSELLSHVDSIRPQVDQVIVVDDGSAGAGADVLLALRASGTRVIELTDNRGIAAALNAGISDAKLAEDDLVVTFDQDSDVPAGFVQDLVTEWDRAERAGRSVAMVAPATFAGMKQHTGTSDHGFLQAREPIQSGTLFSGSVLAEYGPFREDLFIDLVDVEYFLRLRAAKREAIAVAGLDLPHQLGRDYALTVFGRPVVINGAKITTSLSTPFRYYYRARNRVVINMEYKQTQRGFLRRDTAMELRHLILVTYFAQPRIHMLRLIWRGLCDGRRFRMGRIPSELQEAASTVHWRRQPIG